MKFVKTKITKAGNTVIEILIATVVVGVILTALATSMTASIQNSAEAQYRETATRLAQDAMETFRKDKNVLSWNLFLATPATGIYCVPANFTTVSGVSFTSANLSSISGCSAHVITQNNMSYYRAFEKSGSGNSAKITVYVYWNVGVTNKERSTSVEQTFYKVD